MCVKDEAKRSREKLETLRNRSSRIAHTLLVMVLRVHCTDEGALTSCAVWRDRATAHSALRWGDQGRQEHVVTLRVHLTT